eukprot:s414_g5.t1
MTGVFLMIQSALSCTQRVLQLSKIVAAFITLPTGKGPNLRQAVGHRCKPLRFGHWPLLILGIGGTIRKSPKNTWHATFAAMFGLEWTAAY